MYPRNLKLSPIARTLRRNMTPEECHLWYDFLKRLPFPVKRQFIIGSYIVDFYIPIYKTVIEVDGRQHFTKDGKEADQNRDTALKSLGITVLRYSNEAIRDYFEGVTTDILTRFELAASNLNSQTNIR